MKIKKIDWLISYDIRDNKRLKKVHYCCKKFAEPLQYSVFITKANTQEINSFAEELKSFICEDEDEIKIYPIGNLAKMAKLGRNKMPLTMLEYILIQ